MNEKHFHVSLGDVITQAEEILKNHYSKQIPDTWTTPSIPKHGSSYVTLRKIAKTVSNRLPIDILEKRKNVTRSNTNRSVIRYQLDFIEGFILSEFVVFYYLYLHLYPSDIWDYFKNDFYPRISQKVSKKETLQYLESYFRGPNEQAEITNAQADLIYELSFFFLQYAFVDVPNKLRNKKKKEDGTIKMTRDKHAVYLYKESIPLLYPNFQNIINSIHPHTKWIHNIWPMFILEDYNNTDECFEAFHILYDHCKNLLTESSTAPKESNSWSYYRRYSRITATDLNTINNYLSASSLVGYSIPHGICRPSDHTLSIKLEIEIAKFVIHLNDYLLSTDFPIQNTVNISSDMPLGVLKKITRNH